MKPGTVLPNILALFPNASKSTIEANNNQQPRNLDSRPVASVPERVSHKALEMVSPGERAVEKRIVVRVECYRVRLQDPDNALLKPLIDQLRYAGLIPEDSADQIRLEHDQIKVKTRAEEGTKVTLIYPTL